MTQTEEDDLAIKRILDSICQGSPYPLHYFDLGRYAKSHKLIFFDTEGGAAARRRQLELTKLCDKTPNKEISE